MISNRKANDLFACKWLRAPATNQLKGHYPSYPLIHSNQQTKVVTL
jgi:hypothetical protein